MFHVNNEHVSVIQTKHIMTIELIFLKFLFKKIVKRVLILKINAIIIIGNVE